MKMMFRLLLISMVLFITNNIVMSAPGDSPSNRLPLSDCSYKKESIINPAVIGANISGLVSTRFGNLKSAIDLKKMQNGELESVVTKYPSTEVGNKYFKGSFTCNDPYLVVAILSDDGVSVRLKSANGTYGPDNIPLMGQGQALPDTNVSLQLLNGAWTPGETYTIEIDYSNTCYIPGNDIDGLNVKL